MISIQKDVTEWAETTFPASSAKSKLLHLWEELGEAYEAGQGESVLEEIADCGLITCHLASSLDVELPETDPLFIGAMEHKLGICKRRKWGKPDADGVVRHVSGD